MKSIREAYDSILESESNTTNNMTLEEYPMDEKSINLNEENHVSEIKNNNIFDNLQDQQNSNISYKIQNTSSLYNIPTNDQITIVSTTKQQESDITEIKDQNIIKVEEQQLVSHNFKVINEHK